MRTLWYSILLLSSLSAFTADEPAELLSQDENILKIEPQTLQLVKTYEELLKQKPLEIKKGQTVRFGISAASAPKGSGVLVYALIDPCNPAQSDSGDSPDHRKLGPFEVETHWEAKTLPALQDLAQKLQQESVKPTGAYLFCQTVPVNHDGKAEVEIRLEDTHQLYAKGEIKSDGQTFHPWLPLTEPQREELQEAVKELLLPVDGQLFPLFETDATFRTQEPSLPQWSNDSAIYLGSLETPKSGPLPKLWNEDEATTIVLSADEKQTIKQLTATLNAEEYEERLKAGDKLLGWALTNAAVRSELENINPGQTPLEAQQRIKGILRQFKPDLTLTWMMEKHAMELTFKDTLCPDYEFRDKLLVRWWVNGKAYTPSETKHEVEMLQKEMEMQVTYTRMVSVSLDFDEQCLKDLGAKTGDEIELQVMYCPDGYVSTEEVIRERAQLAQRVRSSDEPEPRQAIVSNRVKFIMPEPRKHVQQEAVEAVQAQPVINVETDSNLEN